MKRVLLLIAALIVGMWVLVIAGRAEDKKPAGKEVSDKDAQVKILKAKVELGKSEKQMSDLQSQFSHIQSQAQQIQAQAQPLQEKITLQQGILKSEEDAACKALGLDSDKYAFDDDKMTCSPKPEPVPATPSPAKK